MQVAPILCIIMSTTRVGASRFVPGPIQHTLHCYLSAQNKYGTDKIVLSNRPTSRSTSRGGTSSSTPSTRASALYVRLRRRPRYARGPSRGDWSSFRQLELDELRTANIPATRLKIA